jgi:Putative peptidoglycan binding domain
MKIRSNLTFIATFALLTGPSASFADDSALVRGLIGGIFQTMQQQAQQRPAYNDGQRQFRVEDEAAERLYFRQEIQKRLNMLGYNAGYPDGSFGSQTRSAIAAFQSGIGHSATGKISENEIAILYDKTNGPTIAGTPQQSAKSVQSAISPQPQETSPVSLAPVATLDPIAAAPTEANIISSAQKAPAGDNDTTISLQPSIPLPASQ